MYKVIFLDDEPITLRMLASAIDWEKYGVIPSGTATDGEEGIALFAEVEPEIIIADIRMPRMNGIEFSHATRQTEKTVKIVLLSAYAEFEYAQSALAYQISDYLLKPLDEDKLEAAIARIVQDLESDATVNSTIQKYRLERAEQQLQQLLTDTAFTAPSDKTITSDEIRTVFGHADTLIRVLLVAQPHELQINSDTDGIRLFLKDRLGNQATVVPISPVELVVLMVDDDLERRMEDILSGLRLRAQPVKMGVSRISQPFDLLMVSDQAKSALYESFYSGDNLCFYSAAHTFTTEMPVKLADFEQPIAELVEQGRSGALSECMQLHLSHLFDRRVNPALIEDLVFAVLNWVKLAVTKQYPEYPFASLGSIDRYRLPGCATSQALVDYLIRYLVMMEEAVHTVLAEDPGYYVVKQAKDYTRAHYTEADLSLQDVADCVSLSKNHFSRVFHKVTGMKFWDYVTQLRIEKAKSLLKTSNRSNYEICREIGYESEFYFSKIFKRVVGVSAQEFRRL